MQTMDPLRNLSIVLVRTKTPGNIGAVARCMMNTGLSRLLLVRPPSDHAHEARKFAAGAETILGNAEVHPALEDAVSGHGLVIGASRHTTKQRKNVRTPREMAAFALPALAKNRVALVFGREVNGLEREDLALCHELVWIPSSEAFPSLNLSHAVMVLAYELFVAQTSPALPAGAELAPAEDVEHFHRHLRNVLLEIGFLDDANSERMLFSLRQLFGRSRLDRRDLNILRGILTHVEEAAKRGDASR